MSAKIRGMVCENYTIKKHNTWRVGGQVKRAFWPVDLADLQCFLAALPEGETIYWLGLGSNVLFPDDRFDGTVIITHKGLQDYSVQGNAVVAQAGLSCAKFAKIATRSGFAEAGFFAGIPGTIGGALRMNAGAFGGETWSYVHSVEMIDRYGELTTYTPDVFQVGYRHVVPPTDHWFVGATFNFSALEDAKSALSIAALLKKRGETQPIGSFNCGSVFKNPVGQYAAELIEYCGLKGKQIGGAFVSPKHANFIINDGNATAADIMHLMEHIMRTVHAQCAVLLEPEVKIVQNEVRI